MTSLDDSENAFKDPDNTFPYIEDPDDDDSITMDEHIQMCMYFQNELLDSIHTLNVLSAQVVFVNDVLRSIKQHGNLNSYNNIFSQDKVVKSNEAMLDITVNSPSAAIITQLKKLINAIIDYIGKLIVSFKDWIKEVLLTDIQMSKSSTKKMDALRRLYTDKEQTILDLYITFPSFTEYNIVLESVKELLRYTQSKVRIIAITSTIGKLKDSEISNNPDDYRIMDTFMSTDSILSSLLNKTGIKLPDEQIKIATFNTIFKNESSDTIKNHGYTISHLNELQLLIEKQIRPLLRNNERVLSDLDKLRSDLIGIPNNKEATPESIQVMLAELPKAVGNIAGLFRATTMATSTYTLRFNELLTKILSAIKQTSV